MTEKRAHQAGCCEPVATGSRTKAILLNLLGFLHSNIRKVSYVYTSQPNRGSSRPLRCVQLYASNLRRSSATSSQNDNVPCRADSGNVFSKFSSGEVMNRYLIALKPYFEPRCPPPSLRKMTNLITDPIAPRSDPAQMLGGLVVCFCFAYMYGHFQRVILFIHLVASKVLWYHRHSDLHIHAQQ